jgi:DNA polymerase
MIHIDIENNFTSWRAAARRLIQAGVKPEDILWQSGEEPALFSGDQLPGGETKKLNVPRAFVELAALASYFDAGNKIADKWSVLYRVLYRLTYENKHLLEIVSDSDVRQLEAMKKAVTRDIHKFHAFVRFRRIECDGREIYAAWHEPHHLTVEPAAPFFVRRFGSMRWSILTPKGCAHWDLKELTFSPAATKDMAPADDPGEEMWLTYYRSIFNPFRLKVKMMKKEMPVRHWRTLPEAKLIPDLIREANKSTA